MRSHPLRPTRFFRRVYALLAILFIGLGFLSFASFLWGSFVGLLTWLACGVFILVALIFYRVIIRAKQQALNSALAYTTLADDSFFLYLRSFARSRRILVRNSMRSWTEHAIIGSFWDIEHSLSIALGASSLLVAIGDKKNSLGAAKLLPVDAEWQARFIDLAPKAKNIFVVPHATPSVVWEVRHIASNEDLLRKTWFLMPPHSWSKGRSLLSALFPFTIFLIPILVPIGIFLRYRARVRWQKVVEVLRPVGLALPDYIASGLLFQLNANGAVTTRAPFSDLNGEYLSLLLTNTEAAQGQKVARPWFDRFPWNWTPLAPEAANGFFVTLGIALAATMLLRIFLFQPFSIPSGSMKSTLLVGDYLLASKFAYGYSRLSFPPGFTSFSGRVLAHEPVRGDVVIFRLPRDDSADYISRLIGLPGDEIQMRGGLLHINGRAVPKVRKDDFVTPEEPRPIPRYEETLPNGVSYLVLDAVSNGEFDNTGIYKVPPGHYFMMGDNRDYSFDSRALYRVGYVPYENLVGRAEVIFLSLPLDNPDALLWTRPWTWPVEIRWDRVFRRIH